MKRNARWKLNLLEMCISHELYECDQCLNRSSHFILMTFRWFFILYLSRITKKIQYAEIILSSTDYSSKKVKLSTDNWRFLTKNSTENGWFEQGATEEAGFETISYKENVFILTWSSLSSDIERFDSTITTTLNGTSLLSSMKKKSCLT